MLSGCVRMRSARASGSQSLGAGGVVRNRLAGESAAGIVASRACRGVRSGARLAIAVHCGKVSSSCGQRSRRAVG